MRASYCSGYVVELPPKHPFPMCKFAALHAILIAEGVLQLTDIVEPEEIAWSDLALVHTDDYLTRMANGELTERELRLVRLPWSEALVRRSRLAVRGTVNAARMALDDGIAANLAGGTHHSFATHGEGFCVFNDVAVAVRVLRRERLIQRALVIDLDVHQGNGNAALFADDPETFTFSVHGAKNYPLKKVPSDLDVGIPDGMTDEPYLATIAEHLPSVIEAARPDLVFYLAGVDVVEGDRYGRLGLTRDGLRRREQYVLETLRAAGLPHATLLAGGYAETPTATADLHAELHRVANRMYAQSAP